MTIRNLKLKYDTFEAITDICAYFLRTLPEAEEARNYINKRLNKEQQAKYGFGYFPTNSNLEKLISVVGKSNLESFGIVYNKFTNTGAFLHGHFSEHNLIMPFRDQHGDIVSLLGRSTLPEEQQKENKIQKYKYTLNADKELHVYGLDLAKESILQKNYVICVEGQFDCIACHNLGINNTVALGWSTLSKYQLFQLLKYTDNIILLFDNDAAGDKGRKKAKENKLYNSICSIKTMRPPEGFKDIDEFFNNETSQDRKQKAINLLNNLK